MKKFTFCLVMSVLVHGTVAVDHYLPNSYSHKNGLSFLHLVDSVDELESEADEIWTDLSILQTLCASIESAILKVNNRFLPAVNLQNSQQDDLIAVFADQVKDLRHRVDSTSAEVSKALRLAMSTSAEKDKQLESINDLTEVNDAQQVQVNNLKMDLTNTQEDTTELRQDVLDTLNNQLDSTNDPLSALMMELDERKCEYGSGIFSAASSTVFFKTVFTKTPNVILTVTGFAADLDEHPKYAGPDGLGFDKMVSDVTNLSFKVILESISEGSGTLQKVYCNWEACQS